MFLWKSLAFSMIQRMLAIWSLVPLPFLNPAWTSESSQFMYYWSLAWRILSTTLLVCEMSAIVQWFEHSLALPFFGIGLKTDLFQSCGHCWVFQICWHIECSTFTASSFRIWKDNGGGSASVGVGGIWEISVLSHQFCCELILLLTKIVLGLPWLLVKNTPCRACRFDPGLGN